MKQKYFTSVILLVVILFTSVFSLKAQEQIAILQEPFVILLDPNDGTIVDPTFIDLTPLSPGTPKGIIQVNDEIWISDQIGDRIDRFDLDGNYLSTISGGMDNIKGMAVINNSEVWLSNAGTANGAPGDAIIRFDLDGNNLGFFNTSSIGSSFDIIDTGSEVYVSYIGATESKIERRDYSGNILGDIVGTGVVNFIQQIEVNTSNNSVYAAVFSTAGSNSSGLYEFAISDGSILNYWGAEGSLRGVAQLGDGNILISNSGGIHILNPNTGVATTISGSASQYFGRLNLSPCTTPPTPTGDANQTFNEGATLADIVINPPSVTWFATEADALANTNPLPNSTLLVDGTTYWAVNIVNGCLSEPFAVTVTVLCTPPPTPTGDSNQSLPEGSTIDDIVIDPPTVIWFATEADALANTNPLPAGTPLVDGATYWAVNIVNDCLSEPFPVTITILLGINNLKASQLKVYPNPTYDTITISYSEEIQSVSIYNVVGQELFFDSNVFDVSTTIDVSRFEATILFVKIKTETGEKTVKVLKLN
ncbi:MAG: T9SS type A sorting domain-containing protein [Flavobacteriaceae bacterium]|nr:T9SS type A sorting domain-containing protein [Flavobacteriaceae bacterium]